MSTFVAKMIMKKAEKSIELGQEKYRAYFVNTALYLKYKDGVDTILSENGYSESIVTE